MVLELLSVESQPDALVIRALVERWVPSWNPEDENVFPERCETRISRAVFADCNLPKDDSPESEILALLDDIDPTWTPIS